MTSKSFLDPVGLEQYISLPCKLLNADPDTDVELTNHLWAGGTLAKRDAMQNSKPEDPHPFVTVHDGVKRWLERLRSCTREVLSQKRTAQK